MVHRYRKPRSRLRTVVGWIVVVLLSLFVIFFRLAEDVGEDFKEIDRFMVIEVIDGDTVRLRGGDKLRLANIDTPEKGGLFYEEATQFLEKLVLGKTIQIEFAYKRRDKYGRLLGYMYVDSVFIGREILKNGLGYILLFRKSDYDRPQVRTLLSAQRQAMKKKVGLWSLERESEDYYLARPGSFRLHRPGCRSVKNWKPGTYRVFDTREEALFEGLSPCRRCQP